MSSHGRCLGMFNVKQHMAQSDRKRVFIFNEHYLLMMQENRVVKQISQISNLFKKRACN